MEATPIDIIACILDFVPAEFLGNCRLVCKLWAAIIDKGSLQAKFKLFKLGERHMYEDYLQFSTAHKRALSNNFGIDTFDDFVKRFGPSKLNTRIAMRYSVSWRRSPNNKTGHGWKMAKLEIISVGRHYHSYTRAEHRVVSMMRYKRDFLRKLTEGKFKHVSLNDFRLTKELVEEFYNSNKEFVK
jgi:hypothetical protein